MYDPKKIKIDDFSYHLSEDKIAFHPLEERDRSKLLIYKNSTIETTQYSNIAAYIPENSLMVFNNTKVVEARLLFTKPTGGQIEIFCLEPHEQYTDITTAMLQTLQVNWCCLVGGASKWKPGMVLQKEIRINHKHVTLGATLKERRSDCFVIHFKWDDKHLSFAEVLHHFGKIPLPPYIKRSPETGDNERYQTVYAKFDGSVAAPTAGLHFTNTVLNSLLQKNIDSDFVTLHVGAGTFKPVKAETMALHEMHAEFIEVNKSFIENILTHKGKIVAVGTTSLRTIESLYWIGCKFLKHNVLHNEILPELHQWEAYELEKENITIPQALEALLTYFDKNKTARLIAKTQILIAPGYSFKIVAGLVTNFHQPHSTLLLLVAAFIGEDWHKVYEYALKNEFRFLSYGDGSLLWRQGA